ncbi:uncharacterized protein LOC124466747 isoform X1 [Hypomesus transpacificus]|uniref:uncharacterized protein LOC124466747 isoform X1 n=1 Tax=Hypomesus transpacificus TaxID=137520 RepID=UPI001F0845AB|nr:uncharacterized protein LOC124466747 isoform X1 [Hypomesus transpacificus]
MATASTSGQSRKKKSPGLLDQIGTFFGGEKKKARSKGSFRGHLSTAPPRPAASARRHGADNAVMQFLRSFVSTPQPKSRWREILGLTESLLLDDYLDDFEIARPFLNRLRPRLRDRRARDRRSGVVETKTRCPESSTWVKPRPAPPLNAGVPYSDLRNKDSDTEPTQSATEAENSHLHSVTAPNTNKLILASFVSRK